MNHNIVHAGKRTLYRPTWWKFMIEVAVPGTAAPVLFGNVLYTGHMLAVAEGWD